jgi:hypothetical protein
LVPWSLGHVAAVSRPTVGPLQIPGIYGFLGLTSGFDMDMRQSYLPQKNEYDINTSIDQCIWTQNNKHQFFTTNELYNLNRTISEDPKSSVISVGLAFFFHPDPFFRRPKSLGAEPTAKACGKLVQTLTYEIYPLGEDAGYVAPWTCGEIIGATFSHGLSSLPNGNLQRNYEKN